MDAAQKLPHATPASARDLVNEVRIYLPEELDGFEVALRQALAAVGRRIAVAPVAEAAHRQDWSDAGGAGLAVLEWVAREWGRAPVAVGSRKAPAPGRTRADVESAVVAGLASYGLKANDILVIGDHPFAIIDGHLRPHGDARAVARVAVRRQESVVWMSHVPFAVFIAQSPHGAGEPAPGNPFFRDDLPFGSVCDEDGWERIHSGPARREAVEGGRYRTTFLLRGRRIEADIEFQWS